MKVAHIAIKQHENLVDFWSNYLVKILDFLTDLWYHDIVILRISATDGKAGFFGR